MLEPLCYIINMSFNKRCVPNQINIAKVTPLLNNGDPSFIHNYRPISVLPVSSKIFERLMHNRLTDYITKNTYFRNVALQWLFHRYGLGDING